jgi:hypothetical protein
VCGHHRRRFARVACAIAIAAAAFSGCSGGGNSPVLPPPGPNRAGIGIFDASSQSCSVSYDGLIWYAVPAGAFSPLDVKQEHCATTALQANPAPPIPQWAKPVQKTQAIFVATSLQEAYSVAGMQSIEAAATPNHTPVSWMIGNPMYLGDSTLYDQYHQTNGDDVEVEQNSSLIAATEQALPWYHPTVSVEGAGHERNIPGALALGESGFWGIAWNQAGIDLTDDVGAPWGTYCADVTSYKRPTPDGSCAMLAFEWTARDLTRAYLSGHSEYFSTDPDDLQQRAGFSTSGAATYERALVDAYAAAGETQPLVMVSQQESAEDVNSGDQTIMAALYAQAATDGMRLETLAQAATDARTFSAQPRAIAFPYISGGIAVPSPVLNGATLYPATIDFHDNAAGMTFLAGHTMPTRVFEYAGDTASFYNVPFPIVPANQRPTLNNVSVAKGEIAFSFQAPVALHYGVALWANPQALGLSGRGVTPAGRGGVVLTFDLQPGSNTIQFACPGCTSTTLQYST